MNENGDCLCLPNDGDLWDFHFGNFMGGDGGLMGNNQMIEIRMGIVPKLFELAGSCHEIGLLETRRDVNCSY